MTTTIPVRLGKDSPYRPFLPSPLLGRREWEIEAYIFDAMIESGNYAWIARQWWLSPHERVDIIGRSDSTDGPSLFTIVEVKAEAIHAEWDD
jgi:hypothetical protein